MTIAPTTSARIANAGFIAALLVVFIHIDIPPSCPRYVSWTVDIIETMFCGVALPTFFMISGYLLAGHVGEPGWWGRALRKRVMTLGVPYLLWGALFFYFDYFRSHDASLIGLINSLGFTSCEMPGLYPLWFVRSLFLLVVISPVLIWLLSWRKKMVLVGLFVLTLVGPEVRDSTLLAVRMADKLFVVFSGMFYFTVGLCLRHQALHLDLSSRQRAYLGVAGLALVAIGAIGKVAGLTPLGLYGSTLGVPLLLLLLSNIVSTAPWPRWLTGCAFPVFVLHVFAIGLYNNFFTREVAGLFALFVKYVFAAGLPIAVTVVARRCCPRLTAWAFGGRC